MNNLKIPEIDVMRLVRIGELSRRTSAEGSIETDWKYGTNATPKN